jgi:chromosome segregation ATPase
MTVDYLQQVLEAEYGAKAEALRQQAEAEQAEARAAKVAELERQLKAAQRAYKKALEALRKLQSKTAAIEAARNRHESELIGARSVRQHASKRVSALSAELAQLEVSHGKDRI